MVGPTAGALFLLAALLAASAASAASPPPAVAKPPPAKPPPPPPYCTKGFAIITVSSQATIKLDEDPAPGVSFTYLTPFYIADSEEIAGIIAGRCTFLDVTSDENTASLCDLTFLPFSDVLGSVTVTGVLRSAANATSYVAITGGTQAYLSASGQVKVDVSSDQSYGVWYVMLDKAPKCPPMA